MGQLAAVHLQNPPAHADDALGLGVVKAAGPDILLQLRQFCIGKRLQGGILFKEGSCDNVHPGIRTLGRQPCSNHQLVGLLIMQCADSIRVDLLQPVAYCPGTLCSGHFLSSFDPDSTAECMQYIISISHFRLSRKPIVTILHKAL